MNFSSRTTLMYVGWLNNLSHIIHISLTFFVSVALIQIIVFYLSKISGVKVDFVRGG